MSPNEKRALVFLAALFLLGIGVRAVGGRGSRALPTPGQSAALDAQLAAVDSAARVPGRSRTGRSSRKRSTNLQIAPLVVDVDVASEAQLEALPGVGPALARRIVEDRDACGPFGSLDRLKRVRGIGPALAERLRSRVTFSGIPRRYETVFERCPSVSG